MDLHVEPGPGPWFLRIADAVVRDIERGRLRPGARLPGSRSLALALGVHRNTVVAAYRELASQGWVVAREGSGTRVADGPAPPLRSEPMPRRPAYPLPDDRPASPPSPPPRGTLQMAGGHPDLSLVPVAELGRAWRAGLRTRSTELLAYGDPRGHPRLRDALSAWLATHRGIASHPGGLIVTRGCQQALDLVARALLRPGDRVAVEALGYPPAWAALQSTGAELVPVPVDSHGLDVGALEAELARGPLRAIYLTPHHQFPTMRVLPGPRRLRLLELAQRHAMAVLEDDYDHEFHFSGRPVLPLAHLDRSGHVLYLGTLSKVLAPGLRLGYAVGPPAVIDRMAAERVRCDRQGDLPMEHAVATLMEDGTLLRHLRRMRRVYAARQLLFVQMLHDTLGDRVSFDVPPGGLALWVRWHGDVEAFAARCKSHRLDVETARSHHVSGATLPYFRAGFPGLDPPTMAAVAQRLTLARDR